MSFQDVRCISLEQAWGFTSRPSVTFYLPGELLWFRWARVGSWDSCLKLWHSANSHVPLGFWECLVFTHRIIFKQGDGLCLASVTPTEPKGVSKLWMSRENGSRVENIVSFRPVVLFWLTVPGNLGASQAPGSLRGSHLFHFQHRRDKSSLCDISLWEFEIVLKIIFFIKGLGLENHEDILLNLTYKHKIQIRTGPLGDGAPDFFLPRCYYSPEWKPFLRVNLRLSFWFLGQLCLAYEISIQFLSMIIYMWITRIVSLGWTLVSIIFKLEDLGQIWLSWGTNDVPMLRAEHGAWWK